MTFPPRYSQRGRINSQKGNPDAEPKEVRVDPGWPNRQKLVNDKSGSPPGLLAVISSGESQGFLTPLRDYWN